MVDGFNLITENHIYHGDGPISAREPEQVPDARVLTVGSGVPLEGRRPQYGVVHHVQVGRQGVVALVVVPRLGDMRKRSA